MFVILDIDGTLLDHASAEQEAAVAFGQEFADRIPDYSPAAFPSAWNAASRKHLQPFLDNEISFQEQRRRRLCEIFRDDSMSDFELDELFDVYLGHYRSSWKAFPDVIPFLNRLGKNVGIVSDGQRRQQEEKLEAIGLIPYCSFVLTAELAEMSKPNPAFFHMACKRAGVSPSQACYIGDDLQKDAIGACDAGLRGIWLNRTGKTVPPNVESAGSLDALELS